MTRDRLRTAALGGALLAAACSIGTPPFTVPAPSEIPFLESRVREDSTDIDAIMGLVGAYVASDQLAAARERLERSLDALPGEPALTVTLGLVERDLGLSREAADHLRTYLEEGGPSASLARANLDAVRVAALRAEGARLVAEGADGTAPARDNRVLVIPFAHAAADASLADGLTWLLERELVRDGADVPARELIESVLLELGTPAPTAPNLTETRALMRALGATHAVQGAVSTGPGGLLSWNVLVLTVQDAGRLVASSVPAAANQADASLLAADVGAMVQQIVRGADAISQPQATDADAPLRVDALLAFTRGLESIWADDWGGARDEFAAAAMLEPSFSEAAEWRRRAEAVLQATSRAPVEAVETVARGEELARTVLAIRAANGLLQGEVLSGSGSSERTAIVETLALDRIGGGRQVGLTLELGSGGTP